MGSAESDYRDRKKEEQRGAGFGFHGFLVWCGIERRNIAWGGEKREKDNAEARRTQRFAEKRSRETVGCRPSAPRPDAPACGAKENVGPPRAG